VPLPQFPSSTVFAPFAKKQLLMGQQGCGRAQDRTGALREIGPGSLEHQACGLDAYADRQSKSSESCNGDTE
jgi:hypothetical protein